MKKFFSRVIGFCKALSKGGAKYKNVKLYLAMIVIAVAATVWRGWSASTPMPQGLEATVLRNTEMLIASHGADSIANLKRGAAVRILGHTHGPEFNLWVELADGMRGLIRQESVCDTLIAVMSSRRFTLGDTLLFAGYKGRDGNLYTVKTAEGETVEVTPFYAAKLEIPAVHDHPELGVNDKGWRVVSRESFAQRVEGRRQRSSH